jgi:hypothetical protein
MSLRRSLRIRGSRAHPRWLVAALAILGALAGILLDRMGWLADQPLTGNLAAGILGAPATVLLALLVFERLKAAQRQQDWVDKRQAVLRRYLVPQLSALRNTLGVSWPLETAEQFDAALAALLEEYATLSRRPGTRPVDSPPPCGTSPSGNGGGRTPASASWSPSTAVRSCTPLAGSACTASSTSGNWPRPGTSLTPAALCCNMSKALSGRDGMSDTLLRFFHIRHGFVLIATHAVDPYQLTPDQLMDIFASPVILVAEHSCDALIPRHPGAMSPAPEPIADSPPPRTNRTVHSVDGAKPVSKVKPGPCHRGQMSPA